MLFYLWLTNCYFHVSLYLNVLLYIKKRFFFYHKIHVAIGYKKQQSYSKRNLEGKSTRQWLKYACTRRSPAGRWLLLISFKEGTYTCFTSCKKSGSFISLSLSSRLCLYVCKIQSASLDAFSLLCIASLVSSSAGAALDFAILRTPTRDLSSINLTSWEKSSELHN